MAGYPPPFTPPSGMDWKTQRRAMKMQARQQKLQARMQMRAMRRSSIVGPVLLLAVGIVFLLVETGRLHWLTMVSWYGRWWPVLLIAAGVILVAEWMLDQRSQDERVASGMPLRAARTLGGGTVWLLILVAIVGGLSTVTAHSFIIDGDRFRWNLGDFNRVLGDPHDSDASMSQTIAADGTVTIDNPRGDVTVSGTSEDGQMHIAIHNQVFAMTDSDAEAKVRRLQPVINTAGGHVTVSVPSVEGGHADLTVELPNTVGVTVTSDHGEDIRISEIHAPVSVTANNGNVDLGDLDGAATVRIHNDDATFSAHNIRGAVTLEGYGGDLNVSDVRGDVSLNGNFSGKTHLERVNGGMRFKTHRTDLQLVRLDGELNLDSGSDLSADQVVGPVVLRTSNRNITLDRVQGNILVTNKNGTVTVTSASPLGSIDIENHSGSVDVGVPASAGFAVDAATRHGDMENDFSLQKSGSDANPELKGTVGRGGPTVHIQTSDGDVTVRKSTVAPLPPVPPVPPVPPAPRLGAAPPAVKALPVPRAPAAPKGLMVPAPPVPPAPGVVVPAPKAPKPLVPQASSMSVTGALTVEMLG